MQRIRDFSPMAKGALAELLPQADAMVSLQAHLCRQLPEQAAGALTGVTVEGVRLLVQVTSAAWAFRLRLEQARLLQAARQLHPQLNEISVHVLPDLAPPPASPAAPALRLPDTQTLSAMEALETQLGSDELARSWQRLTQGLRQQMQQQENRE